MVADDVSNGEWCGDLRRRPYGCASTLIASLFCESNRQKAEGLGLLITNDKMLNKNLATSFTFTTTSRNMHKSFDMA